LAFSPFTSAADALEQCNSVTEGKFVLLIWLSVYLKLAWFVISVCRLIFCVVVVVVVAGMMSPELQNFLELNLPKVKAGKKAKMSLGVAEPKLGSAILETTHIPCQSNDYVNEFLRGIRFHFSRFIKDLKVNHHLSFCCSSSLTPKGLRSLFCVYALIHIFLVSTRPVRYLL